MLFRILGGTGLRISAIGLGTGTRFGDPREHTPEGAERMVRTALDLGINYFDTAPMYGESEAWLGNALRGVPRDSFVAATKFFPIDAARRFLEAADLRASVEASLKKLRIESVDILQLHGMRPHWLGPVLERLGSELDRLQKAGKFRLLGVTETIVEDPRHEMIPVAAATGKFAMALIAYGSGSSEAASSALPACKNAAMGVVTMLSARRSPSGAAEGYRFALAHPAVACVLTGTLNPLHLRENVGILP